MEDPIKKSIVKLERGRKKKDRDTKVYVDGKV